MGSRNDNFPRMPMEVPNTTKTAGPIQQDAARNDASKVPMLDIFSFFIQMFLQMQQLNLETSLVNDRTTIFMISELETSAANLPHPNGVLILY
jgi:hypothetical protein